MTAAILDGKLVSSSIIETLTQTVSQKVALGIRAPCLAVVLVGNDPASAIYVENKRIACRKVGIHSVPYYLDIHTTEQALLGLIDQLNVSTDVDGILIQLPLPAHMQTAKIIEHIHPRKDVDGFHPFNMGTLAQGHPSLRPCTPWGIMQLLDHYKINVSGMSALVIGASNIVGRPMALELLLAKATVTIAHSQTRQLDILVRNAELIISATGVPNLIPIHCLSSHHILIDVGIHRTADNKLHGDIDFEQSKEKVKWITPVPGGVGPMTVAMLLSNTLTCWDYFCISSQSNSSSNSPS